MPSRRSFLAATSVVRTTAGPLLLDPQRQGRLKVVGAYYDLDTGTVDFFDELAA